MFQVFCFNINIFSFSLFILSFGNQISHFQPQEVRKCSEPYRINGSVRPRPISDRSVDGISGFLSTDGHNSVLWRDIRPQSWYVCGLHCESSHCSPGTSDSLRINNSSNSNSATVPVYSTSWNFTHIPVWNFMADICWTDNGILSYDAGFFILPAHVVRNIK